MSMCRSKMLISMIIFSMAIPIAHARITPPGMSMKDQTVHPDPFIEMVYQVCKESHSRDVEKCVRLIKLLDKMSRPQPAAPSDDCSYLILENTKDIFPCN